MTVVVATKYVTAEEMSALAEAGVEVVGENRAQDLERKHALHGDAFRWHFIGHLQSNKAKVVDELCELVHSLGSDSAARRLTVPALLEVNLSGEELEVGRPAGRDRRLRRALPADPRAHDDAAARRAIRRPRGPTFDGSASSPRSTTWPTSAWARRRTTASRRRRARRSFGWARPSSAPTRARYPAVMGFSDLWSRTLVYFGIAEDEEWDDDNVQTSEQQLEETYRRRDRQNVRRLPSTADADEWESEEAPPPRRERSSRLRSVSAPAPAKVHLVVPRAFNDAKQIADRFKAQIPVIINLQSADTELSKRLIDFASGLTYALDGSMQRVADKVFLLTPRDVELSAEERARAMERGGFYNQA